MIKITAAKGNFEREPLLAPFGFKGNYVKDTWQIAALLEGENGQYGVGLGLQSPLWSDSAVFAKHGEIAGNAMMYLMTEYALNLVKGETFQSPIELLDGVLPEVYSYGRCITRNQNLRMTFALNSLVAVDNAAWILYCRNNGIDDFSEMIPDKFKKALPSRHNALASVPLIPYGMTIDGVSRIADEGYFLLKIKIGSNHGDGNRDAMLEWDKKRLEEIHNCVKGFTTPYTDTGRILYYLDANGRYDSKERLMRLLDHADKIGALERIILLEEPFPEDCNFNVSDIPVRLAADESAHSDADARDRIDQGYGAIALKPIAKTMSMSLKIAEIARQRGIPCFCADLTVNPVMVDWNKNVAARLPLLPGLKIGMLEANGHQNYEHWQKMKNYHPCCGASWIDPSGGIFYLDDSFYAKSGGIFEPMPHYEAMVR